MGLCHLEPLIVILSLACPELAEGKDEPSLP